jgi:hypothetical protein
VPLSCIITQQSRNSYEIQKTGIIKTRIIDQMDEDETFEETIRRDRRSNSTDAYGEIFLISRTISVAATELSKRQKCCFNRTDVVGTMYFLSLFFISLSNCSNVRMPAS